MLNLNYLTLKAGCLEVKMFKSNEFIVKRKNLSSGVYYFQLEMDLWKYKGKLILE